MSESNTMLEILGNKVKELPESKEKHLWNMLCITLKILNADKKEIVNVKKEDPIITNNETDKEEDPIISECRDLCYYKNGKLHRDGDQPAKICANKLHRDGDRPAIICVNGYKAYFKEGLLHRDGDEPAVIRENGDKEYYKHGICHRDGDKPAVIYANGAVQYWKDGKQLKFKLIE